MWISPGAIKTWTPRPSGRRGAPQKYTDLAIETALTLRLVFRLPLRQTKGFLRSLLDVMGLSLDALGHTTLSRLKSCSIDSLVVLIFLSSMRSHNVSWTAACVERDPRSRPIVVGNVLGVCWIMVGLH